MKGALALGADVRDFWVTPRRGFGLVERGMMRSSGAMRLERSATPSIDDQRRSVTTRLVSWLFRDGDSRQELSKCDGGSGCAAESVRRSKSIASHLHVDDVTHALAGQRFSQPDCTFDRGSAPVLDRGGRFQPGGGEVRTWQRHAEHGDQFVRRFGFRPCVGWRARDACSPRKLPRRSALAFQCDGALTSQTSEMKRRPSASRRSCTTTSTVCRR